MDFLPRYRECFFCSPDGDGVKLEMQVNDGFVSSTFNLDERFQGYSKVAHGGIVAGILDEAMWWTVFSETRQLCVTRTIETEFLRAVFCGAPYRVEGRLLRQEKGRIQASASILDQEGKLAARAKGVFRIARHIPRDAFVEKLDFSHVSRELRDMVLEALR
jgi:uncharacterized protein (TIGR00369 family)